MSQNVVITGVSTGIGLEAARDLIAHGYRVFGSVRKEVDGIRVRSELGDPFTPLLFDVTDTAALSAAVEVVRRETGDRGLAALVNNAGVNAMGPLMHVPLTELRHVFEVNVFGLIAVTQAFLPLLGARRGVPHPPGRIVNVSSISGGVTAPFLGVYSASKHAVESLTDALRRELAIYGIDVIAIEPPSIRTPIFDKVGKIDPRLDATDYAPALAKWPDVLAREWKNAIPMEKVTRTIRTAIEARRPKTRYPLTSLWYTRHLAADRQIDRILNRQLGLDFRVD